MSQGEIDLIRTALNKEPGTLDSTERMYLSLAVRSGHVWQHVVTEGDVHTWHRRLKEHAKVLIPHNIECLRTDEHPLADDAVYFILHACLRSGLRLCDYTTLRELHLLRRAALLRSAQFCIKNPNHYLTRRSNAHEGNVAHAILGGISAEEIGVSAEFAEQCIDNYFHRKTLNLHSYWQAIRDEAEALNGILLAAA